MGVRLVLDAARGHVKLLKMRKSYAEALIKHDGATLDDIREGVTTLEEAKRTARRVLGGAHPVTGAIEKDLRGARAVLSTRETSCTCVPVPGA